MGKSVEIWICTIQNPTELMTSISALKSASRKSHDMTGLLSVRVIYNGNELSLKDLNLVEEKLRSQITGLPLKIESSSLFSLSAARNLALVNSTADWGVYVDDDVSLEPGFLDDLMNAVDQADKNGCVIFGGRVELSGIPGDLHELHKVFLSQLDYGNPSRVLESEFVNGACFGLNREKILEMSLQFSDQLGRKGPLLLSGEESLLISQVRKIGGRVWYDHNLCVRHLVDSERLSTSWLLKRMTWEAITQNIVKANLGLSKDLREESADSSSNIDIVRILEVKSLLERALDGDTRVLNLISLDSRDQKLGNLIGVIHARFSCRMKNLYLFKSTAIGYRLQKHYRKIKKKLNKPKL